MPYQKIHAYVRTHLLGTVEETLLNLGVSGFSYCRVKGIGEYANYFSPNPLVEHIRLEIFVPEDQANRVVEALVETAQTHSEGDGLVAVMPVERVVRIRNSAEVAAGTSPKDLPPCCQDRE